MLELFRVPWARLDLQDVEAFLARMRQDDEGLTWEAKADEDDAATTADADAKPKMLVAARA